MTKNSSPIKYAVIPVAGLGTRLLPFTRVVPKELLPVAGRPVIQRLVEECGRAGIREIVLIVNQRNQAMLKQYFNPRHATYMRTSSNPKLKPAIESLENIMETIKFHYVLQPKPTGDGNALLYARHYIPKGQHFFVSMGDLLVEPTVNYIQDMLDAAKRHKGYTLAVDQVPAHHVDRYGIVRQAYRLGPRLWEIGSIVEKPAVGQAPSRMALIGKYILNEKIFKILAQTPEDSKGEVKLAYALEKVLKEKLAPIFAYRIPGRHFDCGDWDGFRETNIKLQP